MYISPYQAELQCMVALFETFSYLLVEELRTRANKGRTIWMHLIDRGIGANEIAIEYQI